MKAMAGIARLLVVLCLVGLSATAYGESAVEYKIDSLDIVEYSLGTYLDWFTIPVVEGYFPVCLSGWQIASNTEYIYSPEDIRLIKGNDDILFDNDLCFEWVDYRGGKDKRLSILLFLKEETRDDPERILEAVNQLVFEITVEQYECYAPDDETQYFPVKAQPCVDTIRDSSNITVEYELADGLDYLEAAEVYDNHNIVYYANLMMKETQVTNVACWKMDGEITAPWPIMCALGYHNDIPTDRIVYFNSTDYFGDVNIETTYVLIGYDGQQPSQGDAIAAFEALKPELYISPEPYLIGDFKGPYYLVCPKLKSGE